MSSQVILITGCSTGFGYGLAKRLAEKGHTVFASMRRTTGKNEPRAAELASFAAEKKLRLGVLDLDVTSSDSVDRAVRHVLDHAGRIDVVVNNAGVMPHGATEAFSESELQHVLETNTVGPHRVARAVLPAMRAQRSGLIINVTSILGRICLPAFGIYQASKYALEALTESLRYEVSRDGVDVVIVEPGPFATELVPNAPKPADAARLAELSAVQRTYESMMAAFIGLFQDPTAPTDPEICVDGVVQLIETPAGQRPIRTVLGLDFGVRELNGATDAVRRGVLAGMGMTDLEGVKPAGA